jgi:hypothetical protein
MPTGYESSDNALNELLSRRFGNQQTPSPGGMDLNALLNRGIQGTMAGAQEETGIKRRMAASDLLSQQLTQAAQELQNRMKGYEFGQEQQFDTSLAGDPRLQATLADAFRRSGNPMLTPPASRHALAAFHQFDQSVGSHEKNAIDILQAWQLSPHQYPGPNNTMIDLPEPGEVKWARNVLGIGGTTTGTGTNAPAPKTTGTVSEHVPYGFGRAAAGGVAGGAGFYGGSKAFEAGAARFAPKMGAGKLAVGKIGSGLVGSGIAELILSQLDPRTFEAQKEYPKTALISGAAGIGGASKARQAFEKLPFLAKLTRRGAQTKAAVEAAERGVNLGPNYPSSFGGGQSPQQPPLATQGAAPKKPYKPNVKGYEEFLKKQFGER